MAITETWLNPTQNSSEFLDKRYKAFRKDRHHSSINKERGGGVLIAIKSQIEAEQITSIEMNDLEAVCVRIKQLDCHVYVYCLYIQPSAAMNVYMMHLAAIDSIEKQRAVNDIGLYCGDWNLPCVKWIVDDESYTMLPMIGDSESAKSTIAKHVTSQLLDNGLFQICNFKNANDNVLDLFYTNMPELALMEHADVPLIPNQIADKSHVQSVCTIECEPKPNVSDMISAQILMQ